MRLRRPEGHYVSHKRALKGEGCDRCGLAMDFWDKYPICKRKGGRMRRLATFFVVLTALAAGGFFDGHRALAEDGAPDFQGLVNGRPTWCDGTWYLNNGEDITTTDLRDCVIGGSGQNTIHLLAARDYVNGNDASDWIYGQDGDDIMFGGRAGDHMQGGPGDDTMYAGCPGGCDQTGESAYNDMYGDGGNDLLAAQNGTVDHVHGGSGSSDECYVERNLDSWDGCEIVHIK